MSSTRSCRLATGPAEVQGDQVEAITPSTAAALPTPGVVLPHALEGGRCKDTVTSIPGLGDLRFNVGRLYVSCDSSGATTRCMRGRVGATPHVVARQQLLPPFGLALEEVG